MKKAEQGNDKFGGVVARECSNKALQKTQTALGNFSIFLSHNGLLLACGFVARRYGAVWAIERRRYIAEDNIELWTRINYDNANTI